MGENIFPIVEGLGVAYLSGEMLTSPAGGVSTSMASVSLTKTQKEGISRRLHQVIYLNYYERTQVDGCCEAHKEAAKVMQNIQQLKFQYTYPLFTVDLPFAVIFLLPSGAS